MLSTEGRVFQGMGMSEMPSWGEEEFCVVSVSTTGSEFSKAMGSVWPAAHKGAKGEGFGGNAREDIKGVSGDNVREVRDYGNAVPGIGSLG